MFAPDFHYEDHPRSGDWTRDEYFANLQALVEQVPDLAVFYATITSKDRASVSFAPTTGTTPEGARYSWCQFRVAVTDGSGRVDPVEQFSRRSMGRGGRRASNGWRRRSKPTASARSGCPRSRTRRHGSPRRRRAGSEWKTA